MPMQGSKNRTDIRRSSCGTFVTQRDSTMIVRSACDVSTIFRWGIYWLSLAVCFFHSNMCLQTMSLIPPLRVTQLQMELRRNRRREQALIVALTVFEQQQASQGHRERTVWMKPVIT